jgi:hypothetical protein
VTLGAPGGLHADHPLRRRVHGVEQRAADPGAVSLGRAVVLDLGGGPPPRDGRRLRARHERRGADPGRDPRERGPLSVPGAPDLAPQDRPDGGLQRGGGAGRRLLRALRERRGSQLRRLHLRNGNGRLDGSRWPRDTGRPDPRHHRHQLRLGGPGRQPPLRLAPLRRLRVRAGRRLPPTGSRARTRQRRVAAGPSAL